MTRTKENTGKDVRSQINKHFTPGERTFKLKEVNGQVYFAGGEDEAWGLGRRSRRGVASTRFRGLLSTKTLSLYVLHFCCINAPDIAPDKLTVMPKIGLLSKKRTPTVLIPIKFQSLLIWIKTETYLSKGKETLLPSLATKPFFFRLEFDNDFTFPLLMFLSTCVAHSLKFLLFTFLTKQQIA